ncbi:DUF4190 domain-containing protein [Halobacillus litoralis]|uniref:DUF4190 domain-containing protein n=1 Tax=Halobacillus litoralis TaxID=45668 RepID=UPI00136B9F65|nr:DUF4190 domain-containing protein [Halobacillus litoralis]MYL38194.1 DUF4190 domain-containing protein [Halobacillus litoralis]
MYQKAVSALVLGIMSIFLPLAGLITGIIGIVMANAFLSSEEDEKENGRHFAIAGKICSIIGICIQVSVLLMLAAAFYLFGFFQS